MMFFTNSLLHHFTGILITLVVVFLTYYKWTLGYWKRKGVEGPKPIMLPAKSLDVILGKKSFSDYFTDIYFELKAKGLPYGGTFFCFKPQFIPVDIEIIQAIFRTDFVHFTTHGFYVNEKNDPLSAHLFSLDGDKWKYLKKNLTPTFSTTKMKPIFNILLEYSKRLNSFLEISAKNGPVEIKEIIARFTTDVIGCCAFGLDYNSMNDSNSDIRKYGAKVFETNLVETLRWIAPFGLPTWLLDAVQMHATNPEAGAYFRKIVYEAVNSREVNNIVRQDFLHTMIQLKDGKSINDDHKLTDGDKNNGGKRLSLDEVAAHCYLFFLAGFETSSITAHFAIFELSINPDIQKRCRREINEVLKKHDGKLTYEAIMEMNYLELVVFETLRKYPPNAFIPRVCTKNYKIPGTNIIIDKGTNVMIPVLGIHMDSEYYPNPYKFDPERHTKENKSSRPSITWMPFGAGPRMCIGKVFALLQIKVALITVLKNFEFTLNEKTELPMKFCKGGFNLNFEESIWIDLQKI